MTSFRARCLNGLMRLTIRRRIRKGTTHAQMRRQAMRDDRRAGRHLGKCVSEAVTGSPVPVEMISWPGCRKDRAILYFHGGGFCIHLPNVYASHAARLSEHANAVVYVVDYRLAPEHRVATCFDDASATYRWLLDQGIPGASVVIAGDSAGGGLALGACQHARDSGWPLPAGLLLLSPGVDATFGTPSMQGNDGRDPMFTYSGIVALRDMTLAPGEDPADTRLSPGLGSLAGLPPLRFDVGSTELLLDDSRNAADKARRQGTSAVLREWPSMSHVFQIVPWLPETRLWLQEASEFAGDCWARAAARETAAPVNP